MPARLNLHCIMNLPAVCLKCYSGRFFIILPIPSSKPSSDARVSSTKRLCARLIDFYPVQITARPFFRDRLFSRKRMPAATDSNTVTVQNTHSEKSALIAKFARGADDTGSPEVQTALLTARINALTAHFKVHLKDHHSRRGLIQMVSRRRKLLDYLKKKHLDRYSSLIKELGLRK